MSLDTLVSFVHFGAYNQLFHHVTLATQRYNFRALPRLDITFHDDSTTHTVLDTVKLLAVLRATTYLRMIWILNPAWQQHYLTFGDLVHDAFDQHKPLLRVRLGIACTPLAGLDFESMKGVINI